MANQYSQKLGKPEHPVVYHHVPIKTAKNWWLIHNFADPPAPPKKNRVTSMKQNRHNSVRMSWDHHYSKSWSKKKQ
jgi:hypothetical protein